MECLLWKEKFKTVMVSNSNNINIANNPLSFHSLNTKRRPHDVGNLFPGLERAQKWGRVKPFSGIPTLQSWWLALQRQLQQQQNCTNMDCQTTGSVYSYMTIDDFLATFWPLHDFLSCRNLQVSLHANTSYNLLRYIIGS